MLLDAQDAMHMATACERAELDGWPADEAAYVARTLRIAATRATRAAARFQRHAQETRS